jgi:beta-galactosidase
MNLGAQQSMDVQVPTNALKQGKEYFVNLMFIQKVSTTVVPANFNIAHSQFRLPTEVVKESYKPATIQNIKTDQKGSSTIVTVGKAVMTFDKTKGIVSSYKVNGKRILSGWIRDSAELLERAER